MLAEPPHLLIPSLPLPPLTAEVNHPFWSKLPGVPFCDVVSGTPPTQPTTVRAAWDSHELRLLFHALDTHPWATLTERDAPLYQEETVEFFVDPVGNLDSYFEFEINPLNAVLDLVLRRNRSGWLKDRRWRCAGLQSQVQLGAGGWVAELSLPFAGLADPPQTGTRWRANFCRIDRPEGRARELTAWSPTGLPLFHVPARFGTLEFAA